MRFSRLWNPEKESGPRFDNRLLCRKLERISGVSNPVCPGASP